MLALTDETPGLGDGKTSNTEHSFRLKCLVTVDVQPDLQLISFPHTVSNNNSLLALWAFLYQFQAHRSLSRHLDSLIETEDNLPGFIVKTRWK